MDPLCLFPNKIIMETLSVTFEKIQNANEVSRNTALNMPSLNQGLYRSDFGFHLPFDCEIGQTLDQKSVFDSPIGTHPVVLYISNTI